MISQRRRAGLQRDNRITNQASSPPIQIGAGEVPSPITPLTAVEVLSPITPRTAGHNSGQLVMPLNASLTPSSSLLNKQPRLDTVIVPSQYQQALIEKTNSIDSYIKELKEKSIGASSSCTKRLPRELSVSNTCNVI